MKLYRTIVADPPWSYESSLPAQHGRADARTGKREARNVPQRSVVPYPTMKVEEIRALSPPAAHDAHLYLWTTNRHLEDAYSVARAWGFKPSITLVWCKSPRGLVGGAAYTIATEFVLFYRRGVLAASARVDRNWWQWRRTPHSAKPEAFLDLVEQVSPGPYLELFARRDRLGWDSWGDESLQTAKVAFDEDGQQ